MRVWISDALRKWKEEWADIRDKPSHKTSINMTVKENMLCSSMKLKLGLKSKAQFIRWAINLASLQIDNINESVSSAYTALRKCVRFADEDNKIVVPEKSFFDSEEVCEEVIKIFATDSEILKHVDTTIEGFNSKTYREYLATVINMYPIVKFDFFESQNTINELRNESIELEQKNEKMQSSLNCVNSQKAEVEEINKGLIENNNKLTDEKSDLESAIASLEAERDDLKDVVAARNKKIISLEAENSDLKTEAKSGILSRIFKRPKKN